MAEADGPLAQDGRQRRAEYRKRWHAANRERRLAQSRERSRRHYADPLKREHIKSGLKRNAVARAAADPKRYWAQQAVVAARKRARKGGLECTVTTADIATPDQCPVLGMPLDYARETGSKGKFAPNSPSLDRVDNSKGYVPGNVAVISLRANSLKKDATAGELRAVLAYAEGRVRLSWT